MEVAHQKRIAILGATGHIAKALIYGFRERTDCKLCLFSRSFERLKIFLEGIQLKTSKIMEYEEFYRGKYDVIINCIGIGDPGRLRESRAEIFELTEKYDNFVLLYLQDHPETLYINFSSGAVYGKEFLAPADDKTSLRLDINHLVPEDFYGIAKIHSEAKHRALDCRNIVDLRIFGFFSRFIDLNTKYFMNEVVDCLIKKTEFITGPANILRDYINPNDLYFLVNLCMPQIKLNDAFDIYSLKAAAKFEILNYFSENYGLRYRVQKGVPVLTATGRKKQYYSRNKKAEEIGYRPCYSSMDTIIGETRAIMESFPLSP